MGGRGNPPEPRGNSKSSGGSGSEGGGGSKSGKDMCDLSFTSPLQGLDAAVIKKLTKGQILSVERAEGGRYPSVVCRDMATQKVAGSLGASDKVSDLLDCMGQGNVYRAKVTDLGTGCRVQVYRHNRGAEA